MTALDVHDGGKNRGNERYSDESLRIALQKVEGYGERRNPPGEAIARVNLAYIYCGRKELGLAREQANTAGLLVPGINLFMPELASKIALFIHDVNGLGKLEGLFLSVAGEAFD